MKYIKTTCPICQTRGKSIVLYKENIPNKFVSAQIFSARRIPDNVHYRIVKCLNDSLVRSDPILPPSVLLSSYRRSLFTYKEEVKNIKKTYMDILSPVLDRLTKKARILEIGCGNGFILSALQSIGYINVFGLEPSVDAVQKASKSLKKRIKNTVLKKGLFTKNTFDLLFFFQTLDHISDPNTFLYICHSILKPGGYIITLNHDVESLSSKIMRERSPIIDIEHTHLYSAKTIAMIFGINGFLVRKVFKPWSLISLRYLLWLFPISRSFKKVLLYHPSKIIQWFLRINMLFPLGNICCVVQKP